MFGCRQEDGGSSLPTRFVARTERRHPSAQLSESVFPVFVSLNANRRNSFRNLGGYYFCVGGNVVTTLRLKLVEHLYLAIEAGDDFIESWICALDDNCHIIFGGFTIGSYGLHISSLQ